MKTAAKGRPHRTCKDTQPSVILGKAGVYELFNFNCARIPLSLASDFPACLTDILAHRRAGHGLEMPTRHRRLRQVTRVLPELEQ